MKLPLKLLEKNLKSAGRPDSLFLPADKKKVLSFVLWSCIQARLC